MFTSSLKNEKKGYSKSVSILSPIRKLPSTCSKSLLPLARIFIQQNVQPECQFVKAYTRGANGLFLFTEERKTLSPDSVFRCVDCGREGREGDFSAKCRSCDLLVCYCCHFRSHLNWIKKISTYICPGSRMIWISPIVKCDTCAKIQCYACSSLEDRIIFNHQAAWDTNYYTWDNQLMDIPTHTCYSCFKKEQSNTMDKIGLAFCELSVHEGTPQQ
jgi:hypothetical protein